MAFNESTIAGSGGNNNINVYPAYKNAVVHKTFVLDIAGGENYATLTTYRCTIEDLESKQNNIFQEIESKREGSYIVFVETTQTTLEKTLKILNIKDKYIKYFVATSK